MARALNILLIEDNDDDALFFGIAINQVPRASIIHFKDARQAIAHLDSNPPPSLIVLDLHPAGMSASAFLNSLRSNPSRQTIPVVIYTGSDLVSDNVKNSVQATFLKTSFTQLSSTVQEICKFANVA
jgi:response regulator RpfG family c-di-GMP phosphodiesterase